jgi:cell division protein FtsB
VLPVRHYLQQRQDIDRAASALAQLEADNQALQDRVAELGTDAALEELARGQLHLVKPGEEAFAMLPPQFPSNLPPLFPYPLARRILEPRG